MPEHKNIPHMNYQQYHRMRGLVHRCCNYDNGNCLALDDGWDPSVCAQQITYSLCCKWFRAAVLPLDEKLEAELLHQGNTKKCAVCGGAFVPKSNRAKYCSDCATKIHRKQKTASEQRRRASGVDN